MSKVDWSLAPEGATHYNTANKMFYKFCCERGYVFHGSFNDWNDASCKHEYGSLIIERPAQPKPWSGPEDWLPQVNTECEVVEGPAHWDDRDAEWLGSNVKVKAAFVNDLGQSIVAVERFDGRCSCFIIECLAVTKTPEQIAAEKRETAIRELMDIAQVDCRVTAARLVDAGFKREVV